MKRDDRAAYYPTIGDTFLIVYNNILTRVKAELGDNCTNCKFYSVQYNDFCRSCFCVPEEREDRQQIIFV